MSLFSRMYGRSGPATSNSEARLSLGQASTLFKAAAEGEFVFKDWTTGGGESLSTDFPAMINNCYKNSGIVFAVMLARASIFSEMRFQWQRLEKGSPGKLFGTPSLAVFEEPWPGGTTGDMLMRAIQDVDLAGNHYMISEGVGDSKRLRRLRPDWVTIVLTAPQDKASHKDVAGYMYKNGGSQNPDDWTYYPKDGTNGAVAHWAPIPDPDAQYRGMSWLTPVLREIKGDQLSIKHKLKFFENGATPNLAISLKESVTAEQFAQFKQKMESTSAGVDNAYKNLYLGGGADVHVVGADMKQLDFKQSQGQIETRVAAAGRVHPAIVGFSEGLQGSSLNASNFGAAKSNFGDGTLRPLWRGLCAAYSSLIPAQSGARLWYDDSDISFLRQDRKEEAEVQGIQASTIVKYVMNGFKPESAIEAVKSNDLEKLVHTGLVSVQLLPPGTVAKDSGQPTNNTPPEGKPALPGSTPAGAKAPNKPSDNKIPAKTESGKAAKDNDPRVKNDADLKAKAKAALNKKQGRYTDPDDLPDELRDNINPWKDVTQSED